VVVLILSGHPRDESGEAGQTAQVVAGEDGGMETGTRRRMEKDCM
jgi:hypothetical protein